MKYLYLPVEVRVRELDAKLLLAYHAAREGFRVVVGEQIAVEQAATAMPCGIYLTKGYPERYKSRVIKKMKEAGNKLVELDEEGLIINNPKLYIQERMSPSLSKKLDEIYCWGAFQKGVITDLAPSLMEKCLLTGNPRFDLLKKKYRPLYNDRVENLKQSYGDYILVNTRFAIFNSRNKRKKNPQHEQYPYMKKLFQHFIELIGELSHKNPSKTIVVRPHPNENYNAYRKRFSSYSNVVVAPFGNVVDWILASELVIHNGCTTGIEAYLLEKPVISYMPIEDERYDVFLPNQFSYKAITTDDIIDSIHNGYSTHEKTRKQHNVLTHYISGWKTPAYEQIIDAMKQLDVESHPTNTFQPNPIKRSKKARERFTRLTDQDIRKFFRQLDSIEGHQSKIGITMLGRDVFEVWLEG
ncbi:surface carbohydrate biosynthesis protein [Alkalibacillus silvisoli]|uniref:Surface carbohydrate biosynthesis protein n=1 Tax=Alkalibacillus silvisoli TaxID=392823 RepID=A0ABP3JKF3_9BACI